MPRTDTRADGARLRGQASATAVCNLSGQSQRLPPQAQGSHPVEAGQGFRGSTPAAGRHLHSDAHWCPPTSRCSWGFWTFHLTLGVPPEHEKWFLSSLALLSHHPAPRSHQQPQDYHSWLQRPGEAGDGLRLAHTPTPLTALSDSSRTAARARWRQAGRGTGQGGPPPCALGSGS